jgi:hypothetical protein
MTTLEEFLTYLKNLSLDDAQPHIIENLKLKKVTTIPPHDLYSSICELIFMKFPDPLYMLLIFVWTNIEPEIIDKLQFYETKKDTDIKLYMCYRFPRTNEYDDKYYSIVQKIKNDGKEALSSEEDAFHSQAVKEFYDISVVFDELQMLKYLCRLSENHKLLKLLREKMSFMRPENRILYLERLRIFCERMNLMLFYNHLTNPGLYRYIKLIVIYDNDSYFYYLERIGGIDDLVKFTSHIIRIESDKIISQVNYVRGKNKRQVADGEVTMPKKYQKSMIFVNKGFHSRCIALK